ncbi:uncharacterized protein ACB058_004608 [Synchiropus picturatus]
MFVEVLSRKTMVFTEWLIYRVSSADCSDYGTYARTLFMDFNAIFPALLEDKLDQINVPDSLCRWIMDFLTSRSQCVQLGTTVSDTWTLNIRSPQGCVLSPWLFSLYTNCCTYSHESVKLIKFADDTTIIGLISDGDESLTGGRWTGWCPGAATTTWSSTLRRQWR